jgi:hypothetical protein
MRKTLFPLIVCLFPIFNFAPEVRAQVGSGWTVANYSERFEYESNDILITISPPPAYFNDGYCEYSRTNSVEIFQLLSSHSNRAETRPNDDYSSGSRQFQADVMVVSNVMTGECIHQVFNGSTGPYLLLRQNYLTSSNYTLSVGGTLPSGDTGGVVATNLYGAWFQLNSINSLVNGQTYIYVNGVLVWQGANPGGTFYTKYGAYGTHSDSNPADIVFTNAMLFSGGTAVMQDFSLSATPPSPSVVPGGNATYTVTATFTNTVNNRVYFSVSGLPAGTAANFNPASVVGTGSSTLTVSTSDSTPVGAYPLAIVGATTGSSDISHTNTATLTVIPQPQITSINLSGTALTLSGINGTPGNTYYLLSSTNIALPLSQWTPLLTNTFSDASFSITDTINPASLQQYFILQVQ